MADYYAILKRAIDGLPEPTGEARRAVYEKARGALVNQLKSFDPPLSASEITQQRLQLEDSIRKVEAEAAKGLLSQALSRVTTPDRGERPTGPSPAALPGTATPAPAGTPLTGPSLATSPASGPTLSPPAAMPAMTSPTGQPGSTGPTLSPPAPRAPSALSPRSDDPAPTGPQLTRSPAAEPASPPASGVTTGPGLNTAARLTPPRGQVSTSSLVTSSTGAGAIASRMARQQAEATASDNTRPPPLPGSGDSVPQTGPAAPPPPPAVTGGLKRTTPDAVPPEQEDVTRPIGQSFKRAVDDIDRLGNTTAETARRARDALDASDRPLDESLSTGRAPTDRTRGRDRTKPRSPSSSKPDTPDAKPTRGASRWPMIIGLVVAASVVGIGATALWMKRDLLTSYVGARSTTTEATNKPANDKPVQKSTDRLLPDDSATAKPNAPGGVKVVTTQPISPGTDPASPNTGGQSDVAPSVPPAGVVDATPAPNTPPPANQGEVPPIAQKASLLEEAPAGVSQPVLSSGRVIWTAVKEPSGQPGKPDVMRLKARIEIPDRKILLTVSIEPNTDSTLPASHLVKLEFKLPPDFEDKGIAKVPGVIMKSSEQARGDPLSAVPAKLTNSLFWIALAANDADKSRNLQLLKDRGWIDIPFVYDNNRRAMLTIEKAGAGDRVFSDALTAWAATP